MDYVHLAVWGVLVFAVVGLLFGVALAATARKFHVPSNPISDEVRSYLPSANCGACGYAGCGAYADAVVEQREVAPNLCTPGGKEVAQHVARLTGKVAGEVAQCVTIVKCYGTEGLAVKEANYVGVNTCAAANMVFGGHKVCKMACLGFGDCVQVCPFDAIKIGVGGIAEVIFENCTGCAKCVAICPKQTLAIVPRDFRVHIACGIMNEKMSVVREACSVGCVTCRRCVKACPAGAIEWTGSTLIIDHAKCIAYGPSCEEACVTSCPTHILHRKGEEATPQVKKTATPATGVESNVETSA